MEASHKTHQPHIKVGKDEEEEAKVTHFGNLVISMLPQFTLLYKRVQ